MLANFIAQHTGIKPEQIAAYFELNAAQVYADPIYLASIDELNVYMLNATLPQVRAAFDAHLPAFKETIMSDYGLGNSMMSSHTLGNWLLGFLHNKRDLHLLSHFHRKLPREAVLDHLITIVNMLDDLPEGREEWQKALTLMSIPLAAK